MVSRTKYELAMRNALCDFGYTSVTLKMIHEITESYKEGKRDSDLPHGVIGMFCEKFCEEATENGII